MISNDLAKHLTPFAQVISNRALAPAYKAIELSPDRIKACSSFAILEMALDIGIPETVFVDGLSFLSIVQSLPSRSELKLAVKDDVLRWNCGPASGRLALMNVTEAPEIPEIRGSEAPTTKDLGRVLELGGLSCNSEVLGSQGVYGVVVHNDSSGLLACSTDTTTLASYRVARKAVGIPEKLTLHPSGTELLAAVVNDGGVLYFNDKDVVYVSDTTCCYVRQVPDLRLDVREMVGQYQGSENIGKIPTDRIAAFIKRVNALTAERRHARVNVGGADGAITLSFSEGIASSDEYILADDLGGFPEMPPVLLPATKMARALRHIDSVVLDFIEQNVLVFEGGQFRYLVSGASA